MSVEQLALWDLEPTYVPPPRKVCSKCDALAVAKVDAYTWYRGRKAFVFVSQVNACTDHLAEVTEEQRATVADGPHLVRWYRAHHSVDLPGTEFALHDAVRVDPPKREQRKGWDA